jgi:hypothetical protein
MSEIARASSGVHGFLATVKLTVTGFRVWYRPVVCGLIHSAYYFSSTM